MKKIVNRHISLLLMLFPFFVACSSNGTDNESTLASSNTTGTNSNRQKFAYAQNEASQYLEQWLDSAKLTTQLPQIREEAVAKDLFAFYSKRDFHPAWSLATANELVQLLSNLDQEGLNPNSYPLDTLRSLIQEAQEQNSAETGARTDLLLSATYLKLADVIATGKVKPGRYYSAWHIKPTAPDTLYTHLQQAVAGQIDQSLDYFRPQFEQYEQLQEYIAKYTELVNQGGWPEIASGPALEPGDSSARLQDIRQRLYLGGDLETPPAQWQNPAVYDSSLVAAVNRFQLRMGLEEQPTIDDNMIAAMNVPAEMRLKQIMLNLDRIRWFSSGEMPDTYVLVNLPEYRLRVIENGERIKTMKVVVGEQMNSTPIFSDKIEYTVFSPYWNVPTSIAIEEIWPKIRQDPNYLSRNHFEILTGWGDDARVISPSQVDWNDLRDYRIRQKPGPWNSLGRAKFMFPNDYAIYLHDTPADHLFDRTERAFSHGCIRIEEPAWFADWLYPQFNRAEVQAKMTNSRRDIVGLDNKIPVYIFYLTSFVDEEGRMNFREDLYQLDKKLVKQFDLI